MIISKHKSALVALLLGLFSITAAVAPAYAAPISFSSLSQPGNSFAAEGSSYTQQGLTFSGGSFDIWQASSSNLPGLSVANTSLFQFFAGSVTSITAAGNAPFTLNSIDLAPLVSGGTGTFDVTFVGTRADASTVSRTFMVSDSEPTALQTFNFPDFANVVNVSFTQGTNIGFFAAQDTAYQFDNVAFTPAISAVPEPDSLALLAIGAAGLFGRFRKRVNA